MHWRVTVLSILLFLLGCTQPPQAVTPIAEPAVVPLPAPKKIAPPQVVILISEDIPAYSEVAKGIAKKLGRRASLLYLSGNALEDMKMVGKFQNEEKTQFVSIGLSASVAAKTLNGKTVIFCQVYNYHDYSLLNPRHKGVSMLPSFAKTFSAWRSLSPSTRQIGIISGPGFDDEIQAARAAAREQGITLLHETVNSDKEYQYAYKNMSTKVQGYWLLPDNRVLSENILRDILTFSVRNSKQVAVFNEELLKLGGLLSISSNYQDIANQVVERLEQAQTKETVPGADIVYLEQLNLRINSVMAKRFKLEIPAQYLKYANTP